MPVVSTVDLLSDTIYLCQAVSNLDHLLDDRWDEEREFPVRRKQIYGLRQISRRQPLKVREFAKHQCERAQNKQESSSKLPQIGRFQYEIDFWTMVFDLCREGVSGCVELRVTARAQERRTKEDDRIRRLRQGAPITALREAELRRNFWDEVINRCSDLTPEWYVRRESQCHLPKDLTKRQQKEWLERWEQEHVPAFFERFCTHCLFRMVGGI